MEHRKITKEPLSHSPSQVSKLPVLKRSGTYIVEAKSTPKKYTPIQIPAIEDPISLTPNKTPMLKLSEAALSNQQSPNKTSRVQNPRSTSLSMLKQQKRAEISKNLNNSAKKLNEPLEIISNNKSMETILKNARMTGALNLSNHDLDEGIKLRSLVIKNF